MYLEWAKKYFWLVLAIHVLFMIIILIVNEFQLIDLDVFFICSALFGLGLLVIFKIKSNMTSYNTLIQVFLLDITMIVVFILFLFNFYEGLLADLFFILVLFRNFIVLYCKVFNIRGR